MHVWIVRVIQNESTSKSVAVLSSCEIVSTERWKGVEAPRLTKMRVIPESTSLVSRMEIVEKRVIRSDGTLCYERCAVSPV